MGALNADNVQRGRSVFAGKLGEAVASPALNIYDDGTLERGLSSSKCDGEGTPTQKTALIENGMLKNFLYDIYTSKRVVLKAQEMEFATPTQTYPLWVQPTWC